MDTIQAYMSSEIQSIAADASIQAAAKKMIHHQIGSLLVIQGGKYVGIVTRTDMTSKVVATDTDPKVNPVESIMSIPLYFIDAQASLHEADRLMHEKQIRHLVVKNKDQIIGIVSIRDLMCFLAQQHAEMPERRGFVRLPFTALVRYQDSEKKEYSTLTFDINGGGLYIQTPETLPIGSQISIEMDIPTDGKTIQSKGIVAWLRDNPREVLKASAEIVHVKKKEEKIVNHPGGMGVKFTDIAEHNRLAVMEFVTEMMKRIAHRKETKQL